MQNSVLRITRSRSAANTSNPITYPSVNSTTLTNSESPPLTSSSVFTDNYLSTDSNSSNMNSRTHLSHSTEERSPLPVVSNNNVISPNILSLFQNLSIEEKNNFRNLFMNTPLQSTNLPIPLQSANLPTPGVCAHLNSTNISLPKTEIDLKSTSISITKPEVYHRPTMKISDYKETILITETVRDATLKQLKFTNIKEFSNFSGKPSQASPLILLDILGVNFALFYTPENLKVQCLISILQSLNILERFAHEHNLTRTDCSLSDDPFLSDVSKLDISIWNYSEVASEVVKIFQDLNTVSKIRVHLTLWNSSTFDTIADAFSSFELLMRISVRMDSITKGSLENLKIESFWDDNLFFLKKCFDAKHQNLIYTHFSLTLRQFSPVMAFTKATFVELRAASRNLLKELLLIAETEEEDKKHRLKKTPPPPPPNRKDDKNINAIGTNGDERPCKHCLNDSHAEKDCFILHPELKKQFRAAQICSICKEKGHPHYRCPTKKRS